MKAIVIHQYGGPEVLTYEEVERPAPGDDEILIQVKASALNPVDSKIRSGYLKEMMPKSFPFIPGWEVSGITASTGKNVTGLKAGDEVFSHISFQKAGSYAEYVVVSENEVALKPQSLSFIEAAALPLVASAAYVCLFRIGNLHPGQKIFILGAAGSVGLLAVQMAKAAGAYVIGTAIGEDVQLLKSAGADHVIDYKQTNYTDTVTDIDIALDLVGGQAQDGLWNILKKGGLLLSTVMPPSPEKAHQYGVKTSFVFTVPDKTILEKVAVMVDEGKLKPRVGRILPLAEASAAHGFMDNATVNGRIILKTGE